MTGPMGGFAEAYAAVHDPARPRLAISLREGDGLHYDHRGIPIFSTLDTIRGEVSVRVHTDMPFEQVQISLAGSMRTVVENPGAATPVVARMSSYHQFLRLVQPIDEDRYPSPRVLKPGKTYRFPFTFVVPERLLPDVCHHEIAHPGVYAAHTTLPPSLGDEPSVGGLHSASLRHDMAPEGVEIKYAVRASITKTSIGNDNKKTSRTAAETSQRLRIVPASEEHPPLDVPDDSPDYRMRREKNVRKGPLRKKVGRLVMTASQPRPFHLSRDNCHRTADKPKHQSSESDPCPPTTLATVHLRFDPANEKEQPPRLQTLWSTLKATTFFAALPFPDTPRTDECMYTVRERSYDERNVCLASRCVVSASWQKHTAGEEDIENSGSANSSRRVSISSTSTVSTECSASRSYVGKTYYTTSIVVPLTLPPKKSYVPTFHACLASRTYAVDLRLSFITPGTPAFSAPQVSVRVPVQVMGPGTLSPSENYGMGIPAGHTLSQPMDVPEDGVEDEDEDDDDVFTPRTIRVPRPELLERAILSRSHSQRLPQPVPEDGLPALEEGQADIHAQASEVATAMATTGLGLVERRSSTNSHSSVGSASSRAPAYRAFAAPPDYYPFGRRTSNRRIMRTTS